MCPRFDELAGEAFQCGMVGARIFQERVAGAQGGGVALQQGKVNGVGLGPEQGHEAAAQWRCSFDQLEVLGAKDDGAQGPQIIAQAPDGLGVEGQFALAGGPVDFDIVSGAGEDGGADEVSLLAVANHLGAADAAKGAESGDEIDGFQDVGLDMSIVAEEEMESGCEIGVQTPVIAEVAQPEMSQMHDKRIQNSGVDARRNHRTGHL